MSSPSLRTPVILLADDDEDDRQLTQEALTEVATPIDLRCVADGEQLLDYLHRRGAHAAPGEAPRPSVILLDLNMPLRDGHQVLADLKQSRELRRIPVVVLTTSSSPRDVAMSYELGASSYLTKPSTFTGLVELMGDFTRYWLRHVQLPAPAVS